jgi:ribosomal protein S27AE
MVGRRAKCKKCGKMLTVPQPQAAHASAGTNGDGISLKGGAIALDELCSICQNLIEGHDRKIVCGKCGLPFHEECWQENLGCSAYGCANVDALRSGPDIRIGNAPPAPVAALPPIPFAPGPAPLASEEGIPWEFVLLAASVFAAILGAFTCGLPTIVVAAINGVYLAKAGPRLNMAASLTCFALCGIGSLVGLAVSCWIYSP